MSEKFIIKQNKEEFIKQIREIPQSPNGYSMDCAFYFLSIEFMMEDPNIKEVEMLLSNIETFIEGAKKYFLTIPKETNHYISKNIKAILEDIEEHKELKEYKERFLNIVNAYSSLTKE